MRPDVEKEGQDLVQPPEHRAAEVKGGAREEGQTSRENGSAVRSTGGTQRLFRRNREMNPTPPAWRTKGYPPTLGYRGTRVGAAKNPGPVEDLDVEILGSTGSAYQGGRRKVRGKRTRREVPRPH